MENLYRTCQMLILLVLILAAATARPTAAQAICQDNCGDLRIPFPFGTKDGCYLNQDFLITCNASNIPLLGYTNAQVIDISVQGQLRVLAPVAYDCYDKYGQRTNSSAIWFSSSKFPFSDTLNKFTAVGCDTLALVQGSEGYQYATGCISYCVPTEDLVNGSCSGTGCCQSSIPKKVMDFAVHISAFNNHQSVWNYNPCSYAFMVEENAYEFSTLDLADLRKAKEFPVVLDWAIGNETCNDAQKRPNYACRENSICYEPDNGPGYRCNCTEGYEGNPYVSNGCQDIDECKIPRLNQCTHICKNTIGNYTCSCFKGYHGDGRKDGSGCSLIQMSRAEPAIIGASISVTFLLMAVSVFLLGVQKRKMIKLRREYFKQNGGILLQQLLSKSKKSTDAAKLFSEQELKKATNNFSKSMVIGEGGFGVVYKGILLGDTTVAIKKSHAIDRNQIEQFVNEVIVLSQIHHPNAVKLLGCCLETPVPLLVYEFITNGTLFFHLHDPSCTQSLPWEKRLQIAEETAEALAYMHSVQIIHRDVKSANILLDDTYTAKVSDFGVSRLVPFDQDKVPTLVQGTLGYIDPEYFQSGILTEKSDVYSFGVVLVELLTGKKAICSEFEEKSLVLHFISSLKENYLFKVLEDRVKQEGNVEQLNGVAELARSCLRLEGDRRPTMKQVIKELEMLRQFERHPQIEVRDSSEDNNSFSLMLE